MTLRMNLVPITAMSLCLAAGAVCAQSTIAHGAQPPMIASSAANSGLDFRSYHWLGDRKVVNANNEEIASVSELILDRGSGRIEYLAVKTGSTLGLGGKTVAVPYGAFRWDTTGERLVMNSTPEQLKQFPEYSGEHWTALKDPKAGDASTLRKRLAEDAAATNDPYAASLDTAKHARIEGEITSVERVRSSTFGEQVVVTVRASDGTSRKVALGPSWFVNSSAAAPMRGDKVVVDTLAMARDPGDLCVGSHLKVGERELALRNTDGSPTWVLKTDASGTGFSTPYLRYVILSDIKGMKVDCRGNDLGKVYDVILDRNSGQAAFLSIDPNQNFLGISDTKRLVPWSVATVTTDKTVRIDASKEMVLASGETPSDLSTLNTGSRAESVYKAYQVPMPTFDTPKPVSAGSPGDAWGRHGVIIAAIERGSAKTMTGKVVDVSEVKFDGDVKSARSISIRTEGDAGTEETVLLGPSWYMDNQKAACKSGDVVTVEACRTVIGGKTYWLARSIDCKSTKVVLLDSGDAPAWAPR